MTQDRNYLRMMHDCELTHYAKEHGTTELEFVLLERLCTLMDVDDELEAARDTIKELQLKIDLLTCELHDMEGTNLI
jgi:uncharacterized coiled-coil protein SlyX